MSALDRLQVALGEATTSLVIEACRETLLPEARREWVEALAELAREAEGEWLPAEFAARRLGISLPALYAKVRRGTVPATKHGRRLYVNRDDLDAEMEKKKRRR